MRPRALERRGADGALASHTAAPTSRRGLRVRIPPSPAGAMLVGVAAVELLGAVERHSRNASTALRGPAQRGVLLLAAGLVAREIWRAERWEVG